MPTLSSLLSVERESRKTVELRSYVFEDVVFDPKQADVLGEVIKVFAVRAEWASSGCDDGGRFRGADIGKFGA